METFAWLRNSYFPEIVNRFNSVKNRRRFALYQNEKLPSNERNLTDVRTRMGLLIEYSLAQISNEVLSENGIDDFFWSHVVANRFPDLEVRRNDGRKLLRFEVKSLQCVAEEKSANFDTLVKDINPYSDYVVVFLWDWDSEGRIEADWDSAPRIIRAYVFHAYSLSRLRDSYWLNCPPTNVGDGYQGYDVRFAVTCENGIYSKEQGNYGKLMRVWKDGFPYGPEMNGILMTTKEEYLRFQRESLSEGFRILANRQLLDLSALDISMQSDMSAMNTDSGSKARAILPWPKNDIMEIKKDGNVVGYQYGDVAYFMGNLKKDALKYGTENGLKTIVMMNSKYKSSVYKKSENGYRAEEIEKKPKDLPDIIRRF
ncbi:MAG: hypothetical protein LUD72_04860 [Bacteroidales bacterium]|nr:hypothetical protein [Bacteroidales bacterium]